MGQHVGRLVALEVDEDGRDDLWMLVLDNVGDGWAIHPLERLDAAGIVAAQDAVDHARGPLGTEGLGQHGTDVDVRIQPDAGLHAGLLAEVAQDVLDLLALDVLQLGHRCAELLHLARGQVLEYLDRLVLADGHQQDRAFPDTVFAHGVMILVPAVPAPSAVRRPPVVIPGRPSP